MLVLTKEKHPSTWRVTPIVFALFLYLLSVFAILPLIPSMTVQAFEIPKPTASFYVNDTADLMSEDNENYIIGTNEDLYEKTGAQVVVVTVKSLDGTSIEEYATKLFREYGIGDAEKNNGVLILLSLDDRECRIEVGYGLEGAINDAKAGRIMDDYMIPFFREGQWDEGMTNGFDALMDEVCKEYDIEVEHHTPQVPANTEADDEDVSDDGALWGIVAAGILALIAGLIVGKEFPNCAMIPGSIFLIIDFIALIMIFNPWHAFFAIALSLFAYLIGWGITSPDVGDYSGGSSYGGYSSSSRSSSSSSYSSRNSGGGGRSGGGGASRKF